MARPVALFDVDGTLTIPRNKIKQDMIDELKRVQKYADIAIVGGSDYHKILD